MAQAIVAGGFEAYYATRTQPAVPPTDFSSPTEDFSENRGEAHLILEGVRCAACLWLIEQALARLPGVTRAEVNYATQRAHVAWEPARASLRRIVEAIREVGYLAWPYDPRRQEAVERRESRAALWRLFVAGFAAMQVMMYSLPAYLDGGGLSPQAEALMRWASLLLTLPVMVFSCAPFFSGALQDLRQGRIGLDVPIALGLAFGFLASAWATVSGAGEVYFDSISMLVFLLLGARYAEAAARRRARRQLDPLLRPVSEKVFSVNDVIRVAPGERVPADGVVIDGASSADESLLTGESRPVPKRAGDELAGGSVNLEQPLAMRVTRAGADTRAAALARLAERGAASRPKLVAAADRVARHLTWVIVATALAAAAWWGNLWVAVAVLVAACPCALALASPVLLTRAGAAALGRGALLANARALDAFEGATDVVLDKTGTLTTGRMVLARVELLGELDREACLEIAGALEAASRHPIALAFSSPGKIVVERQRHFPGKGIDASLDGKRFRVGSEQFCRELAGARSFPAAAGPRTRVFLAVEGGWLALFELEDELRPGAAELVAFLKERGIAVHLASGDALGAVVAVAGRVGIGRFAGGMTPQDKFDYVERLQRAGRIVVMVGDGLNDAPVLARADASVALAGGADAAQLRADVIVLGNSLTSLLETFNLARRVMRLVRQNLGWALAYNAAVLPLAAAGWIGPWEAALGMGASSLAVLLNALRPLDRDPKWKASPSSYPSRSPSYS